MHRTTIRKISSVLPRAIAVWLAAGALVACGDSGTASAEGEDGEEDSSGGETDGGSGSDTDGPDSQCMSNERFFEGEVQTILQANCQSCHNVAGDAQGTEFLLETSAVPDYLERNLAVFEKMSKLTFEGEPWIMLKPTGVMEHGGGTRFQPDSPEHEAFQAMISRLEDPVECLDQEDIVGEFFADVDMLDDVATLRKSTVLLAGRVPTTEEVERVRDGGEGILDEVLLGVMREEGFYERVRDIYNDRFLTRRYHSSNPDSAIDLLSRSDYPRADSLDNSDVENAEQWANDAIAEEPLRLIEHILRNDLSYTEVLTADYTMVNPYSAQVYGVEGDFEDPEDPNEFIEMKLPGVPHAGIATMTTYLSRWTTTRTNRNRARSRRFQKFFLATDVLALGTRPTDASGSAYDNPTLDDQNCVSCHSAIDPIAASFANWDAMGRYRPQGHPLRGDNQNNPDLLDVPENGWYTDMRPAGYKQEPLPGEWEAASLQWLAYEAASDDLFALSPVHLVYQGLFGRDPLIEPTDPNAPGFLEGVRAAKAQRKVFQEIADKFQDSDYDLRVVFLEMVKSPYFRAYNFSGELSAEREVELADIGIARWLTPEELNSKLVSATDVSWGDPNNPSLLNRNEFLILYGGINSDDVVERGYDASGTSANVAKRMSNQVACAAVARDFVKPENQRLLFPFTTVAGGPNADVRENIVYLHWHLLGENLDLDDPEIDRTYQLFVDVYEEGQRGLNAEEYGIGLGNCAATTDPWTGEELDVTLVDDEDFTIRAWIAVTSYMLTDWNFLHE